MSVCREEGHTDILKLVQAAPDAARLHRCVSTEDLASLGPLIYRPGLLNTPDHLGRTPLLHAVDKGSIRCFKALIRIPEVNMEATDKQGRQPEEVARWAGKARSTVLL